MSVINPSALLQYQIISDKDDKEKSNLVEAVTTLTIAEWFRVREPKGDPNFITKDFKLSLIQIAQRCTGARKPIRAMFGDEARSVGLIVDVLCIKQIPRLDDGSKQFLTRSYLILSSLFDINTQRGRKSVPTSSICK